MSRTGTNNGGGPRWGSMPRAECPRCGLVRPVGVTQHERGNLCRNTNKCHERMRRRKAEPKRGYFEEYSCGCVSPIEKLRRDLPGYCPTHGSDRRHVHRVHPALMTEKPDEKK